LKIVDRISVVKYPGEIRTISKGKPDERTFSMEQKGEFVFIEGIADKQKKCLEEQVKYYLEKGVECLRVYDDKQLKILSDFLEIKSNVIQYKNEKHDMFMELSNRISKNPPKFEKEYEDFIIDLMKNPDSKKRRYIKSRAEQKNYHDFESALVHLK